jgi:hypothetical protein
VPAEDCGDVGELHLTDLLIVTAVAFAVPPIFLRCCSEIATKLWRNLLYAVATGAAFDALAEDR